MKLVWTRHAKERRLAIFLYIADDNPDAALTLDVSFDTHASRLLQFPHSGRNGRISGTKEIVVCGRYIIVYRVLSDAIQILTIYHTAQQYPPE